MLNKEKLLSHIIQEEERIFLTKVLDKVEKTLKTHTPQKSDFLDPYQISLADSVLKGIYEINYKFAGGYPYGERQRIIVFPDYCVAEDIEDEIVCLKILGNFKFQEVSHRDFLGSILALGIKREKIGDILVIEDGCQVFIDRELEDYVTLNITKIHRVSVKVNKLNPEEVIVPEEKLKSIETTVSSLRLDVVIAAGFGLSRSQATKEIDSEKVKVNWGPNNISTALQIKAGDTISIRGKGRLKVEEIKGITAKGRVKIFLKRFI